MSSTLHQSGDGTPGARSERVWRRLVVFQLVVAMLIMASLLSVVVMGVFGSLFTQAGV